MAEFTHLSDSDLPKMVDVSHKMPTERTAVAVSRIQLGSELAKMLKDTGSTKKGPVFQTAVIAGIQGAKKTSELIPMCHPLPLSSVSIDISLQGEAAIIKATAKTTALTGVEMEALTAASVAALTLYDMCKSVSKSMVIESTFLLEKKGGKSGDFQHPSQTNQKI
ncbi:MAG: cyclic pyranopterin monophosphate synthase MoaC [SAR324 cluster bacterium]|nr:cyclic pyranopterin monophosphate synthase MoaC [SAR324 cluster bacterium]